MTPEKREEGVGYAPSRRRFLELLSLGLGGAAATAVAVPFIGFLLAPLFSRTSRAWRSVGSVKSFKVGKTVEVSFIDASPLPWAGLTARSAAYLRREGPDKFTALSVNCTHLGCPVRWIAGAELFMCPCHGGVYYKDGTVAAGPPPRPLRSFDVRVRDGNVEIQASPVSIA
jgi:quinol---cytochrome c reductase iron-sulfur subunit, bacillus type